MPRSLPLVFRSTLVALPLIAANALGQETHPTDGCGKAQAMRQLFESGLDPLGNARRPPGDGDGQIGPREAMTDTDVLHNALDIEVIPASTFLSGSNTMTVKSLVDGLSTFTFMLGSNFTISDITLNGATTLTVASLGNYARQVTFPTPINAGDTFTLKITYSGTPISHGYGSIRFSSHSGVPIVCTLSEPYFSGDWWPAKDGAPGLSGDNSDKATFEIWVTAPDNLVTASNGLLQGVDVLGGNRKRYRWQTNYPMASYLACFSSTNYNTWTSTYTYPLPGGGTGSMPAQFFVTPENDWSGLRATWNESLNMMAVFRPLYGEYPFVNEKYGIYEFVFSGGMEHQTMTGQLASTDASLTAHELAHQWWGDNVTCRTWNDIWLNEGFATYSQALWAEFRANNPVPARASLGTAPTTSGSVYRYDTSSTGVIFNSGLAYNKGAWVLHGLRHACGSDAAFFSVLAAYRAAYQGHSSTTDAFASVASAVLGRDMQPFFDAWVYGEGAPKFAVSHSVMTLGGTAYMKLRLRQAQASPAAPLFPTPVDIRVIRSAVPATYLVESDAVSKYFVIPLTGSGPVPPPNLDPDNWILRQSTIVDAWVPGPPVLIASTPAPGITLAPATPVGSISLVFSENITASAGNFQVSRQGSGPIPFTYSFIPATQTATLAVASPLPPGTYTVTTSGPIRANAQDLDGEMTGNSLPSGNGIPGGELAFTFTVQACPADFNADGGVDFFDYDTFVSCFEGGPCPSGTTADFDADGSVDFFDYDAFVVAFESPC